MRNCQTRIYGAAGRTDGARRCFYWKKIPIPKQAYVKGDIGKMLRLRGRRPNLQKNGLGLRLETKPIYHSYACPSPEGILMDSLEEHSNTVISRYDEFQAEAAANLLADYKEKKNGRYLLVIPTGGGKTYTAVKAINCMFASKILDPDQDTVVWGAHRNELINQAKETFQGYAERHPEAEFSGRVFVGMMREVMKHVASNESVRIAVIDEAHHAVSKNITYGPLFQYPQLGILGLTATPSRHDGEPLDFEKESFSIGFPEMVERQLILSPTIEEVKGGRFEEIYASGVSGFTGLEELDCPDRDKKIVGRLLEKRDDYQKIIIYAASKDHVRNLHKRISHSDLINRYESVDYILGGNEYSGNDADRDAFVERIKSYKHSIVINCDVLTEGYDDPTVNTVVMATPTRSKLVYMQAIGRCIRVDKNNPLKKAYIVEVVDDLPNIRYRINNRWLFSEISDSLEPDVEDRTFASAEEFKSALRKVIEDYNVSEDAFKLPEWDKSMRYSLLLFRSYVGDGNYRHLPIMIDGRNRALVSNWFNFLSERMANFHNRSINFDAAMKMARYEGIDGLGNQLDRELIYESMEEAFKQTTVPAHEDAERECWITFVSLRFKGSGLSPELAAFLDDVVNREQLEEIFISRSFLPDDYLLKLPLPLASSIGLIVSEEAFMALQALMNKLQEMRDEYSLEDHLKDVDDLLKNTILPIPPKYMSSLPNVVRENFKYFIKLD